MVMRFGVIFLDSRDDCVHFFFFFSFFLHLDLVHLPSFEKMTSGLDVKKDAALATVFESPINES